MRYRDLPSFIELHRVATITHGLVTESTITFRCQTCGEELTDLSEEAATGYAYGHHCVREYFNAERSSSLPGQMMQVQGAQQRYIINTWNDSSTATANTIR